MKCSRQQTRISLRTHAGIAVGGRAQNGLGMKIRLPIDNHGVWLGSGAGWTFFVPNRAKDALRIVVAVGTTIADRPRTDPYKRVYAYGSYLG